MNVRKAVKWDRSKGRPEPIRLLNLITEVENDEPLVKLQHYSPSVRILRPQVIPYLRKEVAVMLERAAHELPGGFFLGVIDAWRPLARQKRIYEWVWNCAKEAFPDRNENALRRTVCRWVAPVDQKAPPGHCTGAAVDVWLVDENNEQVDLTSPWDRYGAAPTYTLGLSKQAQANRDLLVKAMLSVGFSNCRDEWWHYSYGDAGWAVRMGLDSCHYGNISLSEDLYRAEEQQWLDNFHIRVNPFLESE